MGYFRQLSASDFDPVAGYFRGFSGSPDPTVGAPTSYSEGMTGPQEHYFTQIPKISVKYCQIP